MWPPTSKVGARGEPWHHRVSRAIVAHVFSLPAEHRRCAAGSVTRSLPLGSTRTSGSHRPAWSEVVNWWNRPSDRRGDVRNHAIFCCIPCTGFARVRARPELDDIDWTVSDSTATTEAAQSRTDPLFDGRRSSYGISETQATVPCRALFVTLKQQYRPLSAEGSGPDRVRQRRLGQTIRRYGPHGLRHAGATYLLGRASA